MAVLRRAWLLAIALAAVGVGAADGGVNGTTSYSCSVPLPPQDLPPVNCTSGPAASSKTLEDAQSIDTWYNATDLFLTDFRRFPNSTFNYILSSPGNQALFGSRTFRSILNSTALAQVDALLAGAPFDARNLSAARVHYTVSDYGEGQSWLYNFNLFYSWNGCSNQALAVSADGRAAVREYLLCPVGVHEADLERVSVIVCKADGSVQRVAYSQHGWTEVRDCGRGQCRFAEGTSNPLAFVGLDSHANYPDPSPLAVYEFLNASVAGKPSLDNLGGVWLGDRTAGGGGGGRRWAPRPDNVVYIPPPDVIVAQNLSEFQWALYTGNWGAPLQVPRPQLYCFDANQTELTECAQNSTVQGAINSLLNLVEALPLDSNNRYGNGTNYTIIDPAPGELAGYPSIPGPLLRAYSYTWDAGSGAPIHSSDLLTLVCPLDIQLLDAVPRSAAAPASLSTLTDYLVALSVGNVALAAALILLFALPVLLDRAARVRRLAVRAAGAAQKLTLKEAMRAVGQAPTAALEAAKAAPAALAGGAAGAVGWGRRKAGGGAAGDERNTSARQDYAGGAAFGAQEAGDEERGSAEEARAGGAAPGGGAASDVSAASAATECVEADALQEGRASSVRVVAWALLASGLYISGLVLLLLGILQLFSGSIVSAAVEALRAGPAARALQAVLIGLLVLVGLADVVVIFLLFFIHPREIRVGRVRVRNYLGGHPRLVRASYGLHVACVGLTALVVNAASLLVALGFVVVVLQLGARVLCKDVMGASVLGVPAASLCVTLPALGAERVCGWQAVEACFEVTDMRVADVVVGGALLLWSHLVWLVALVASLEGARRLRAVAVAVAGGRGRGRTGGDGGGGAAEDERCTRGVTVCSPGTTRG